MAYFENAKSSWAHPNFWSHDKHMMGNRLEHNTSCRSEKWEITCSSTPLFHQFWWLVNNVNNLSYKFHGNFKLEFQTWILSPVCLQVSTHGYSQNQILVWKYPSLTQVAKLTGHSYRVLYLVRSRFYVQCNWTNYSQCCCFSFLKPSGHVLMCNVFFIHPSSDGGGIKMHYLSIYMLYLSIRSNPTV